MVLVVSPGTPSGEDRRGSPCAPMTPKDARPDTVENEATGLPSTPGKGRPASVGRSGSPGGPAARPEVSGPTTELLGELPGRAGCREAIYERVSGLLEAGKYREAGDLLSRGLEIYPESVDLLKELGVLYHLQGQYGKAARTFTRVMNITGEGTQSLSWRIASLSHKALEEYGGPDPERSLASFDQLLALDPTHREALAGKIAALRVLGRLDEARDLVKSGLALDPPGPSILYQEGWLHMDQDEPDPASRAFGQASLADPGWPDPVLSMALALKRLGRGAGAGKALQAYVESRQGVPGLRAGAGWFALMLHDLPGAKEIFLGLAKREGDPGGFHGLAALLFALGRTGEAGVILEKLAAAYPRDPLLQVNRAMVLARMGGRKDLADAAVAARRALSLDPRFAPAHTCLGIIAFWEGRPGEAGEEFTLAARLPGPLAERNLGLLACALGRWEEAEHRLLRTTRLDPLDARAWAGLGAVSLRQGKAAEAVLRLRHAALLDPRHTGTARGLALALARSGDPAGAEEALRRALALTPGPGRRAILLELAALLVALGGPGGNPVTDEEAGKVLAEAGDIRRGDPGVLFYEGVIAGRLGNPKLALDRFTSCLESGLYRIAAQENIRRIRKYMAGRKGVLGAITTSKTALALLSLLQLGTAWSLFMAGLVSELALVLLLVLFSALFALALYLPLRNGGGKEEPPLELVIPPRIFVPVPEAEMVSPLIRLRTALRP
jgi:tetratricopeptide (TPR) repeat protein